MINHLLESSHRDDWSDIGLGREIMDLASIQVNSMHLIRSSDFSYKEYHFLFSNTFLTASIPIAVVEHTPTVEEVVGSIQGRVTLNTSKLALDGFPP